MVGEGMSLASTYIAIQYWDITVLMLEVEVAMSHDIDLCYHPTLRLRDWSDLAPTSKCSVAINPIALCTCEQTYYRG